MENFIFCAVYQLYGCTQQAVPSRIELVFMLTLSLSIDKHLEIQTSENKLSDLNKRNYITRDFINIKLLPQKLLKKQI